MSNCLYQASCVHINQRTCLITGKSGLGKSSVMLDLIYKGGQLISDDLTLLSTENNDLFARPPDLGKGLIEVRALGIVKMDYVMDKKVDFVVELTDDMPPRLPHHEFTSILGIQLPIFKLKAFDFALTNTILTIIHILNGKITINGGKI